MERFNNSGFLNLEVEEINGRHKVLGHTSKMGILSSQICCSRKKLSSLDNKDTFERIELRIDVL